MTKKTIIWLRSDLRLSDNDALNCANKNNQEILFFYIFNKQSSIGSAAKWFLHQALESFQNDIKQKYNAHLIIKQGNPRQILEELTEKYHINNIFWNKIYEPQKVDEDTAIEEYFKQKNL